MLYRLLRNNIESGPFSNEEIIKQGLLPSDQLKLEGEDQWHAPTVFSEFKEFTTNFPKPKFKITANKEVIEIKESKDTHINPSGSDKGTPTAPFKRVPSAVPRNRNAAVDEVEDAAKKPHTSVKASVQHIDAAPPLEKKERKVQAIKKQKKVSDAGANFKKEVIIPLSILAVIGVLAFFAYKKFTNPSSLSAPPVYVANDSSNNRIATTGPATIKTPKDKTPKASHLIDSSKKSGNQDSSLTQIDTANELDAVATAKPQLEDSVQNSKKIIVPKEEPSIEKTTAQITKREKEVIKPAKAHERKISAKKGKSINDFVALSLNKVPNKEIRNIKIRIKNISTQTLNIAVVDVKYLDANGNTITGETLEAANIGAGKTATIKVPNNKNAVDISYKVSLISGDSLYLMAH